jgi:glycosyltransferase involved in cell wall biosynthesis
MHRKHGLILMPVEGGPFLAAGDFQPEYRKKLAPLLSHSSADLLGRRNDVSELMRKADLFVLHSIEEGFGLVCTEAKGSRCLPIVPGACTDLYRQMENDMVHMVGDLKALTGRINLLHRRRDRDIAVA